MILMRHPVRGFLGGLFIGLGLGILVVIYGAAPLGAATIVVLPILFAAVGLAAAWVLPARRRPVAAEHVTTTTPTDDYRP